VTFHLDFSSPTMMSLLVAVLLIAIIVSLVSALMYVCGDREQDARRAAKALTWRIALSLVLFVLLIGGHYLAHNQ
jgi:NADH:ubiquinone oxidoreductase subunit 6 (subunit J)